MKKATKIIVGIVISIAILLIGIVIYIDHNIPINPDPYAFTFKTDMDKQLTKEEVIKDRNEIIDIMEKTHPIFLEEVPKEYYKAKESFIKNTNKEMIVKNLGVLMNQYLSSIKDGHTFILFNEQNKIDINWKYTNNKLIILDKENNITSQEVININGISIRKIIDYIDNIFPAENYVAREINYSQYTKSQSVLEECEVNISKGIILEINNNGKIEELEVQLSNIDKYSDIDMKVAFEELNEDTCYIDLGICDVNESLEYVTRQLKQTLNKGATNVIVDVRDNPGGDSKASTDILDTLNMKYGEYGGITRFSPLASNYKGYLRKRGDRSFKGNNQSEKNENINLYVITNEKTFSSATMLAVLVKDGKLGTIVGQPSSNMPSCFGDIIRFQLSNSKLEGQISHKKLIRPDLSKIDERVLEPDIKVNYDEDPVKIILKQLKEDN